MFNAARKALIYCAIIAAGIFLFTKAAPAVKPVAIGILKVPVVIVKAISKEIGGIVFYHKNMVENERLKSQSDFLRGKINDFRELGLENARLHSLLELKQRLPFKAIAAKVIARSPDNWSSSVIIDKGSSSGIKRGLVVINFLGLVGRVVDTTDSTSKIMLINDPNLGISAIVQRSRQEGLISGTLGSSLIMRYLPKDSDIKISDTVITSGLTDTYPKGMLIGKVIDIGSEFSGLSRYAIVKPAVDLSDVEEVLIIIR